MALIRWEPFREVESLQKEMNRLFDRLVPTDVGNGEKMGLSFIPAAEITETPEAVQLKLEIPGMEAKDLNVEVTADSLTINGERKSEIKTEEEGFTRTEFRYGKFHRVIPLPVQVDNNNVAAEYKDGILNLTLPKAEEEKNKVVKVSINPAIAQ
ncbi:MULTISPECIES: Hsp20/alpha crystallin family protein [unclassified Microcystis]|jgi:HSP20 family protein|uniref:Hsp20/alpha crystallin family protein n=1 Tax=Microcystis flos-aquae Mf_QC_C_20070823_S10D TaxID=2486236 RepID=A0A552L8L9_9CHRO|nr:MULTISPECIES: Hsp20/alpha crystallin family protein [unclassified Microcystis]MCA2818827.1 Hsp20/alpha crystallin family protein [Microcystis sp. M085S1]MCA2856392.1 Hsp20/alpha crystallin family protein [Microcystis sp. M065S1]TRT92824.1 MAG: Hsp20/alpha crystallin family protein [Microcystis flos-aquae Ma_QC_C_20070823_S18D]TRV16561.1 MAG: Hsp20/alpha crystallin family protein [Microcystis flos-aquae Mf_QC_C_20070823_S10D]TRV22925.1 MAG: Hsp20/alpha crystallin family protein [Microcystis 